MKSYVTNIQPYSVAQHLSIKDILVFLDDGAANADRTNAAFHLTNAHGANLTGASLASMKPIHAKSDDDQVIMRMADKQAHKLADEFTQAGAKVGLNVKANVISGGPNASAQKMAHYARNADLVMLGQPDPSRDNF